MNIPAHCGKQSTNSDLSETAACFYKSAGLVTYDVVEIILLHLSLPQ